MKELTKNERTVIQNTGIRSLKPQEPWQQVVFAAICTNCGKAELADEELPVGWMSIDVGRVQKKNQWEGSTPRTLCDDCTQTPACFVLDTDILF